MATASPLCPDVFSCAPLVLASAAQSALSQLLLLGDGHLGFASEGLCRIQLVEIDVSSRISQADLSAQNQRLVQRCPLL